MYQNKDLLENLYVVKKYMFHKHDVDHKLLGLLLTLYPKGYFNDWTYKRIDKDFKYMQAKKLIEEGWLEKIADIKNKKPGRRTKYNTHVYSPTKKFHDFIDEFYGLLAGEYDFPETWVISDVRRKSPNAKKKSRSVMCLEEMAQKGLFKKEPNPKEIYFKDN